MNNLEVYIYTRGINISYLCCPGILFQQIILKISEFISANVLSEMLLIPLLNVMF